MTSEDLARSKRTGEIRLDYHAPIFLGELKRWGSFCAASRVHHDIDFAECCYAFLQEVLNRLAIGNIRDNANRVAAKALDFRGCFVHLILSARAWYYDRSGLGKSVRDSSANARCATD